MQFQWTRICTRAVTWRRLCMTGFGSDQACVQVLLKVRGPLLCCKCPSKPGVLHRKPGVLHRGGHLLKSAIRPVMKTYVRRAPRADYLHVAHADCKAQTDSQLMCPLCSLCSLCPLCSLCSQTGGPQYCRPQGPVGDLPKPVARCAQTDSQLIVLVVLERVMQ